MGDLVEHPRAQLIVSAWCFTKCNGSHQNNFATGTEPSGDVIFFAPLK